MPFTLSHAAAVLPALRIDPAGAARGRGPLLAAGLVAGSLAPDVPLFVDSLLPGSERFGRLTHRPIGVLTVDPLIAAALAAGWAVVREPVIALLPHRVRDDAARLLGVGAPRPAAAGWFWVSAVTGAASHVAWDAFTHRGRWGVRRFPALDREVRGVPLHHWAQYGSSVVGLAALAGWSRSARRQGPPPTAASAPAAPTAPERRLGVGMLAAGAVVGGAARCLRDRPRGMSSVIASVSFGAGAALSLAAGAYAGVLRLRRRTAV